MRLVQDHEQPPLIWWAGLRRRSRTRRRLLSVLLSSSAQKTLAPTSKFTSSKFTRCIYRPFLPFLPPRRYALTTCHQFYTAGRCTRNAAAALFHSPRRRCEKTKAGKGGSDSLIIGSGERADEDTCFSLSFPGVSMGFEAASEVRVNVFLEYIRGIDVVRCNNAGCSGAVARSLP